MGFVFFVLLVMTSCSTINQTMREPNSSVKFVKEDFTLSDQVSAEAKSVTILCIDWARLFSKKMGSVIGDRSMSITAADIPVIGSFASNKTKNYALYNLMSENSGYDVVFYPQYKTRVREPFLGIGFILKITTVEATARLGKLKGDSNSSIEKNRPLVQKQQPVRSFEQTQSTTTNQTNEYAIPEEKINETEVNSSPTASELNQSSKPVAGEKAYNSYIEKSRRPLSRYDDCNQHGKVILSFNVNNQGRPENIYIFRSLCPAADREAIRLLQNGPDWTISNTVTRWEISF